MYLLLSSFFYNVTQFTYLNQLDQFLIFQYLIYLLSFSNCLNYLVYFKICQCLIYLHQILSLLNQSYEQNSMYQHLLHILVLLHNQTILIFINPTVKRIIVAFPCNIQFITFPFYYIFKSQLFLICFLQYFYVKRFNNSLAVTITNNTCDFQYF